MNGLRDVWVDLVDKRLWPIAAALVLALVAVPLLLLEPAPEPVSPRPPAVVGAPAGAPAVPGGLPVADVTGTGYLGPVEGAVRDPFRPNAGGQPPVTSSSAASAAVAASAGAVASSSGAVGSASPSTGPSSGGGSSGAPSSGTGSSGAPPSGGAGGGSGTPKAPGAAPVTPAVIPSTVAIVRFGLLGGESTDRRVAELTPLPSPLSPAVVYLGQTRGGEAAFLIPSDTKPFGQGRCLPDPRTCSRLYLDPGEIEYLTVATTAGRSVRYRLRFVRRLPA